MYVCVCVQHLKKQKVADAEVDCIKQQMVELCRSDTLSRSREKHDRDLTAMREQHDARVLTRDVLRHEL